MGVRQIIRRRETKILKIKGRKTKEYENLITQQMGRAYTIREKNYNEQQTKKEKKIESDLLK